MAFYLLSPAQLSQALLSYEEFNAICEEVSIVAQEAIEWFDTARRADQLANTKFIFTLVRFKDARVLYDENGKRMDNFGWCTKEEHTFEISRVGGPAYDWLINVSGVRAVLEESVPRFPRQPTASLPVEQIITVDKLTKELFNLIRKPVPQEVVKIELSVQLFDLNENCIATNEWLLQDPTSD